MGRVLCVHLYLPINLQEAFALDRERQIQDRRRDRHERKPQEEEDAPVLVPAPVRTCTGAVPFIEADDLLL
jgi:hypothetical protein